MNPNGDWRNFRNRPHNISRNVKDLIVANPTPWWVRLMRIQRDAANVRTIKLRNPYPGLGRYLVAKFMMAQAEILAKEEGGN